MSGLPDLALEIRIPQPHLALDILVHRDAQAGGVVLDYFERHEERGVLFPIMGGRPIVVREEKPEGADIFDFLGVAPTAPRRHCRPYRWSDESKASFLRKARRRRLAAGGRVGADGATFEAADPLDEIMRYARQLDLEGEE